MLMWRLKANVILLTHKKKNETMLFGSLKSKIKGSQKQLVWKEITPAVNRVGVNSRSAVDV